MLDFLRDLTKSAEEKQQEMLTAYVDGELSPPQQRQVEQLLANDPGLQAELAELRQFKLSLSQLPRRRVPRNFTLDPALYGVPKRQPLIQLYPLMRTAMTLTAVFLFIAVGAEFLTTGFAGGERAAFESAPIALQTSADEPAAAEEIAEMAADDAGESTVDSASTNVAPAAESSVMVEEEVVAEEAVEQESMDTAATEAPAEMAADTEMVEAVEPMVAAEADAPQLEEEAAMGEADVGVADESTADAPPPAISFAETPTPMGTAVATDATSGSPRIQPTNTPADRAVEPLAPDEAAEVTILPDAAEDMVEETADDQTPALYQEPVPTWRLIQIGLAVLLFILIGMVLYTRRLL
jgi:hypothetical protein